MGFLISSDCYWVIRVSPSKRVVARFTFFNITSRYESVTLFDGANGSTVLATLSSSFSDTTQDFITTENVLTCQQQPVQSRRLLPQHALLSAVQIRHQLQKLYQKQALLLSRLQLVENYPKQNEDNPYSVADKFENTTQRNVGEDDYYDSIGTLPQGDPQLSTFK
uniref:CUB domain-containing protein n=1 Tax=Macrostomum lignano TaxID=282301 RepID=A0A1I8G0Q6_9PLAT